MYTIGLMLTQEREDMAFKGEGKPEAFNHETSDWHRQIPLGRFEGPGHFGLYYLVQGLEDVPYLSIYAMSGISISGHSGKKLKDTPKDFKAEFEKIMQKRGVTEKDIEQLVCRVIFGRESLRVFYDGTKDIYDDMLKAGYTAPDLNNQ